MRLAPKSGNRFAKIVPIEFIVKRIKSKDSILHPTPNSSTLPQRQYLLHQHTPELLKVNYVRVAFERVGDCIRLLYRG